MQELLHPPSQLAPQVSSVGSVYESTQEPLHSLSSDTFPAQQELHTEVLQFPSHTSAVPVNSLHQIFVFSRQVAPAPQDILVLLSLQVTVTPSPLHTCPPSVN